MASKTCQFILLSLIAAALAHAGTYESNFDYEKIQLTDNALQSIRNSPQTAQVASLVAFDDGRNTTNSSKPCKTFPGDSDWPSQPTWDAFNNTLDGQLVATVPIAAPCYDTQWGAKDPAKCQNIVDNFQTSALHENDPTSVFWPIFLGRTCMPNNATSQSSTCTLGGYPTYAVNVSTVAQLQLAINFARNTNIRLVIKNTGHCYLGKSSGAGSLSVWMHNHKDIEFAEDFEEMGKVFKVGSGVVVKEMYEAAEDRGVSVQGGICPSVGYVGGYLQGGGHNPLSGYYGMATDSVVSYNVVLANGSFVTASATSYPDLFWALRGGGGGSYGVVTSAVVKAHPKISIVHSRFSLGNTTEKTVSRENWWKMMRYYWAHFPEYTDRGTYSFFIVSNVDGQLSLLMRSFFAPGHTLSSFANLTKPLFDLIDDLGIPYQSEKTTKYYDSFLPAYMDAWGNNPFPIGTATSLPANRLIPREHFTDPEKLNSTLALLETHVNSGKHFVCYHQAPRNRQKVDNGVSSGWRNAQAFAISSSSDFSSSASATEIGTANQDLINDIMEPWRKLVPASQGGGSYLNEAAVDEPKWQEDFYGEQYGRLVEIKRKYDPRGLFYATTAVGSDEWVVEDGDQGVSTQNGRLCRARVLVGR